MRKASIFSFMSVLFIILAIKSFTIPLDVSATSGNHYSGFQNLKPSQIEMNTDDYEITYGSQLQFATLIDYNKDSTQDYLFVVNHQTNPSFIGNSLIIVDGKSPNILFQAGSIMGKSFDYRFRTANARFSDHNESDIVLFFQSNSVSGLCGVVLLDTINFITYSFQTDCNTYEDVVDIDGDGYDDYVASNNLGNYVFVNLKSTFDNKMKMQNQGSLKPTELEDQFENLVYGNFTGDSIVDYSFTQLASSGSEIFLYIIDGSDNSILENISYTESISDIKTINLDNAGLDELIFISGSNYQLKALNATGNPYSYNQLQLGSLPTNLQLISDIDDDQIPEIIVTNNLGQILIISGASGIATTISPIANSLTNSITSSNDISVAFISNTPIIVIQKSILRYRACIITNNHESEQQFSTPWKQQELKSNVIFNEKIYNLNFINLELNLDIDNDKLSSLDEFYLGTDEVEIDTDEDKLSDLEEYRYGTNPLQNDTDYDLIPDNVEIGLGLNPTYDDAQLDNDKDGLLNINEWSFGTRPYDNDTDGDSMPDGWEVQYGLDPIKYSAGIDTDYDDLDDDLEYLAGTSPINNDTDGDFMIDGWEVKNGLDPKTASDANLDDDRDGLTNLEEAKQKLDPQNADWDSDGLPDGWEVKNGLDPKTAADADIDSDHDLIINRYEYKYGLNPTGTFDPVILFSFVLLITVSINYTIIEYIRANKQARELGFENYWHRRRYKKLGFETMKEKIYTEEQGFKNAEARNLVVGYGESTLEDLISSWVLRIDSLRIRYDDQIIDQKIARITNSKNPVEFKSVKIQLMEDQELFTHDSDELKQHLYEVKTVTEMNRKSLESPFISYDEEAIHEADIGLKYFTDKISSFKTIIDATLDERENWFKPWGSLLELIRVTGDNVFVPIAKICQITGTTEAQAEDLIKLLLDQNSLLGKYDEERKMYIKGIKVDDYIDYVLKGSETRED